MLGQDHLAEDVTQEVFMHVARSIPAYDPTRELAPWVFTIAANKVRDHWRSRAHHDSLREESLEGTSEEQGSDPPSGERGPLPKLEEAELKKTLDVAIDALPPTLRETLVLRWFEGLSFEAIGAMIARNETAVRKRYSRALAELRSTLEKHVKIQRGGGA
jgi:RNA polymerase sigma-70 factor (ECF subfamily)